MSSAERCIQPWFFNLLFAVGLRNLQLQTGTFRLSHLLGWQHSSQSWSFWSGFSTPMGEGKHQGLWRRSWQGAVTFESFFKWKALCCCFSLRNFSKLIKELRILKDRETADDWKTLIISSWLKKQRSPNCQNSQFQKAEVCQNWGS